MKLRTTLSILAVAASAASAALSTQGCGDTEGASTPSAVAKTVPPESGSVTTSAEERTFAVDSIALGEADIGKAPSPDAWKTLGFDLDGQITNVASKDAPDLAKVCKRADRAQATIHQDGERGIDNSFGKQIIKLILPFNATPSASITESIRAGTFTILLKVVGLNDDPLQTNTGLSSTLLVGSRFSDDPNVRPTFTQADDWPFNREPQIAIGGAYINQGVYVNGRRDATVKLLLSIGGEDLSLQINRAIISFKHDPAAGTLESGTIAGVIDTEELVNGLTSVAGRFNTDLCTGANIENVKTEIRKDSDMIADGTQDPGRTCNGISIGIGFTAKRVGQPTKAVEPAAPTADPCNPTADGGI